jgi:hypothetical protein
MEYLSEHWTDLPQILNLSLEDQTEIKKIIVEMKTTSNGRRPQNIKSWISQQPLIRSSSNFKLMLRRPNKDIKYSKWRQPPLEDDLKILKVEYLSNHSLDPPHIFNLISGDQTKISNAWNEYDL